MAENEEKDLKSSSSIESNETFEEKMARIQAILNGQKSEIENRKVTQDIREEKEQASSLEEATAPESSINSNTESVAVTSETESEIPENISENISFEPVDSSALLEHSSTLAESEGVIDKVMTEESDISPSPAATPVPEPVQSERENFEDSGSTKKSRMALIIGILVVLLIAFGSVLYFQLRNKTNDSNTVKSSSSSSSISKSESKSSSSKSSSSTESSSSAQSSSASQSSSSSSSSSSAAAPTRAEIIASVQPGRVPLDPNITGQEPEFNWPAGLQDEVIQNAQAAGWGTDGYKFIPAQIVGGQGWVNLYDANGQFVASVDLATRYILQ